MTRRLQIAVCGASSSDAPQDAAAEEVGRRLAEAGAVLVCGGREGVMAAVATGAAAAGGDVIGVLPGSDPLDANPGVTHAVATGVGAARNLAVVASADAVIAIGGAWGTLSEIALAGDLGRTVVALESWSVLASGQEEPPSGIEVAASPQEAVARALEAAEARRQAVARSSS